MADRPTVWQMVREAVEAVGSPATYPAVREYIWSKYGDDVNQNTINAQLVICSVNNPSRIHFPENQKPRVADGQYDFLFKSGRGEVSWYIPAEHGRWEIKRDASGKMVVAKLIEVPPIDDPGEPTEGHEFALEAHLRDYLARHIDSLRIPGVELAVYVDSDSRDGVEYPTDVGPIDILAIDAAGNFFVIELKVSRGADRVAGQILRYMGWVKKHLAADKKVFGVIVAGSIDDKLLYAASMVPNVTLLEYRLRFDLNLVALEPS